MEGSPFGAWERAVNEHEIVTGFAEAEAQRLREGAWDPIGEPFPYEFRKLAKPPEPVTFREIWAERLQRAWITLRHPFQVWRFTRGVKRLGKMIPPLTEGARVANREHYEKWEAKPEGQYFLEESTDSDDPIDQ